MMLPALCLQPVTDSLPETPEEIEDEQPEQTEFSNAEVGGNSYLLLTAHL